MKIKKLMIVILLLIFTNTPIHAATNSTIMIISDEIPYIIIAELGDHTMQVNMIPASITLPLPDVNNYPSSLQSLDYTTRIDTIKQSIQSFYNKSIDHVANVHLDTLASDLQIPLKDYDFSKMSGITDFFEKVADNVEISMIFHYKNYITSDMGISNYYSIYKMFQDDVDITYAYASYYNVDDLYLPLDNILCVKN